MDYKILASDFDNTLVPFGEKCPRPAVVAAVQKMQAAGAKFVLSTGRAFAAVNHPGQLGGIRFDYAITCNGACVLDSKGSIVAEHPLTPEEMYALVDFCDDYSYPLQFNFRDAYYAYAGYEYLRDTYARAKGSGLACLDGEDQDRHLRDMPFGAFGILPPEAVEDFAARYGHLGLQFVPYHPGYYDINRAGTTKAVGVKKLMERCGWKADELLSMGDNDNDVPLMKLVGRSWCMANGSDAAKAAASAIAPPVTEEGVAAALRQEFFPHEF